MHTQQFTRMGPSYWDVKDHLFDQYINEPFDEASGLPADQLNAGFATLAKQDGSMPRMELRSRLFAYMLDNARIGVDPVDWFADHFDRQNLIMARHREEWRDEFSNGLLRDDAETIRRGIATGSFDAELDLGHIAPGWQFLMRVGAPGLLSQVRERRAAASDEQALRFYDSAERTYRAFIRFMGRLEAQAKTEAIRHPEAKDRMDKLAGCLANLQTGAPQTLYEALQLTYLFHQLIEFEGERVRSMGSFERNFGRFYEADLAAGRITEEDAKELIRFFWMKFHANTHGSENGKNFYFGGHTDAEHIGIGPLTYVALDVFYELNQPDPKLSIKISSDTPDRFVEAVARCLRDGRTSMVLANDDVTLAALEKRGVDAADRFDYLLIGCYEPAIEGLEAACNMCIKLNLAKPVELALFNGVDPLTGTRLGPETGEPASLATFEDFFRAYETQLETQVRAVQQAICHYEEHWAEINPSPFLSATFTPCLESGRDISAYGPKYNNTGSMGGGLATAADSLLAIRKTVYDEQRYTLEQLQNMLRADFDGFEKDRLYLMNRVAKWGNNQQEADDIGCAVAQAYTSRVNGVPNGRGGIFTASLFTLNHCFTLGHHTGATPDGRKEGAYIAKGIGAMTGQDRAGVTGQIQSVTKLDYTDVPNGSVLDLYLHPSAVDGDKGIQTLSGLIRAYFAQGGYAVQFNILNADELRRAQKDPESYATLQVRVCGWNVYFVSLTEELQNHFIETTMQRV